uniref:Uncharacterized protein n=1 Tax=Amphimedon queenslandica TaxID=400682 RepID=A0A1X7T1W4_AMPQE
MSSSFKYWPQVLFILIAPLTRLVVPLMCILQLVLLLVTNHLPMGWALIRVSKWRIWDLSGRRWIHCITSYIQVLDK